MPRPARPVRRVVDLARRSWARRRLFQRVLDVANLAAQAPRPIRRSSVGRWRAFEPWLGPSLAERQPSVD